MDLTKLINYAIEHGSQNTPNYNMEFEIRFGKYNRVSSNINQNIFLKIYSKSESGKKTFQYINETFYDTKDKDPIRQRIIYNDAKNLIKNMYDKPVTINQDAINKMIDTYAKIPSSKTYISKNKIMKVDNSNIFKAEIVCENNHTSYNGSDIEKIKKHKFRCSWLEDMWNYDITIILIIDPINDKSGIFYEVEIEYNHESVIKNKYTFDDILNATTKHINHITTIIECSKLYDVDVEIKYSLFNAVQTMERSNLGILQNALYSVVDKADGERRFIYIDKIGNVFHFNPTEGFINKIPLFTNKLPNKSPNKSPTKSPNKTPTKSPNKIYNTLIDCEMIDVNNVKTFYGFDLLFFNNSDYRNYNLNERLDLLNQTINELNKIDKTSGYKYAIKKFYTTDVFKNAEKIWKNRGKLFPYNLDGLIFTPIRGSYIGNLPNLKYKPLVSIDVRLMYRRDNDFTEFYSHGHPQEVRGNIINVYTDHKTNKIYYKSRVLLNDDKLKSLGVINSNGILGYKGRINNLADMVDIVEMEFEPESRTWKFLRTRPDKEVPNAFKSIVSALNAIKDNITIDEISKLKHIKSPFENVSDIKECFVKSGFNFTSNSISSPVCSVYSYAFKNMIDSAKCENILVLGCDMCLLNALINSKCKNIVIIESNCLEVYGESKSEGYRGLLEILKSSNSNKTPSSIKIIWGDVNIANGLKSYNKAGQLELNKYKKSPFDSIFISSFENALFNSDKFDKSQYEKYMNNLKLLVTTNIIGLFLSGDKILSHLDKQDCLLLRNKELHPLWKIYVNNKNISKYKKDVDIFKIKEKIKMVEIQRIQNSFIQQYQPLVFDDNISNSLNLYSGIKQLKTNTIKSFYTDYKKSESGYEKLNDYDCIISDLTRYFIGKII